MENKVIKILKKLKSDGFFSKYLPKTFKIDEKIFNINYLKDTEIYEPYYYSMPKNDRKDSRRIIAIPDIYHYCELIKFLGNKQQILKTIIELTSTEEEKNNTFSRLFNEKDDIEEDRYPDPIKLIEDQNNDVLLDESKEQYLKNMKYKIEISKGAKGILHVDIAEFYKNIYTHSIIAIKFGAEEALRMFKEKNELSVDEKQEHDLYGEFDKYIRHLNGNRTNGILVGPYISKIVAEALLARVDEELRKDSKEGKALKFTRYSDDYEIVIYEIEDYKKALSKIIKVFNKYYLTINSEKTRLEEYPFYVFKNYCRIINIEVNKDQKRESDITALFHKFWNLENEEKNKSAMRYLLKKILPVTTSIDDIKILISYLINIIVNDNRYLHLACPAIIEIDKNEHIDKNDKKELKKIIEINIKSGLENSYDLEVVWLLYLYIKLRFKIGKKLKKEVFKANNDLAKIMLLHEYTINKEEWKKAYESANSWIFIYELLYYANKNEYHVTYEDMFKKLGNEKRIKLFEAMIQQKITFYAQSYK